MSARQLRPGLDEGAKPGRASGSWGCVAGALLAAMLAVPRHALSKRRLPRAHKDTARRLASADDFPALHRGSDDRDPRTGGRDLWQDARVGAGCDAKPVLSRLARDVYAVERIRQLLERAKENWWPLRTFAQRAEIATVRSAFRRPRPSIRSSWLPRRAAFHRHSKAQLADRSN